MRVEFRVGRRLNKPHLGSIATYVVLGMLLVFALFPLYWMLVTSLKSNDEIYQLVPTLWPHRPTLKSFATLFLKTKFLINVKNSFLVAGSVSAFSIVLSVLAAYAISRLRFKGRTAVSRSILYAYLMPRSVLFIPLYIFLVSIGLNNSIIGLIVIYPTITIPYATWILISYFNSIPAELEQAAAIDGCSRIGCLARIVIPLSLPGIVSTLIFMFTLCWCEYLYALVVITKGVQKTLTLGLADLMVDDVFAWGPLMGGSIIASIPVVLLYMVASRYLVTGMTLGGVKQ